MLGSLLKALRRTKPAAAPRREAQASFAAPSVAFLTMIDEPHFLQDGERFESDQASMRLRVGIPARELARDASVWLVPVDYVRTDPGLARLGSPSAVVVGKFPVRFFTESRERATALIEWIESSASTRRIVVDFSDDLGAAATLYSQPVLLEFQKRFLQACHATVPTHALRERLIAHARHGISVVEDPFESLHAGEPRFEPGDVLRLIWFGVFAPEHRAYLELQFGNIAARLGSRPVELSFVTYAAQSGVAEAMARVLRDRNPQFALRHVPWSVEATARELARADIAVLPQDAGSEWGRVKSHNRLVESIRAGRFAVASAIPAYLELSSYAWVGNDLASGVEWALQNPAEVSSRIVRGQEYVAHRFAPATIGAQWARVLQFEGAAALPSGA
jgi:hypothetical protein